MKPFTKDIFDRLAKVHNKYCISIYLNPINEGSEKETQNVLRLKNIIKDLRNELENAHNMKKWEAEEYLKPLSDLLDTTGELWRYPAKGLAIFYHDNDLNVFELPFDLHENHVLSDHYYLLPMAEVVNQDWAYYLLRLSMNEVRFYRGDLFDLKEVPLPEDMPESLNEAVGGDYEEKHLQFRKGQDFHDSTLYHGHGSGSTREKKDELHKFCQAIDKSLNSALDNKESPLLVACVDYLFPIYKDENNYPNLAEKGIYGNHERTSNEKLHKMAVEILMPEFHKLRDERKARFHELLNKGLSSYEPDNVVPATIEGRVDTLFVNVEGELTGRYSEEDHSIERRKDQAGNVDLLNKAVIETILHDGMVYIEHSNEMPYDTSPVNAIFRY